MENRAGQVGVCRRDRSAGKFRGEVMKSGFGVFFAVAVALGGSWVGFVVAPTLQLGTAKQTTVLVSGDTWPQQRTGEATLGMQIYRANGCVACHTEQVRQQGVLFNVVLTSPGKNPAAVT